MKRLLWFRRDLRTSDNPLLSYEGEVLPIFIFDTNILSKVNNDDRRVSYLFYFVEKLKKELQVLGLDLKVFFGESLSIIKQLQEIHTFDEVVASGDYDSYAQERDRSVSHILDFRYLDDTYLFQANEILKSDGTPYYVFKPFYDKAIQILEKKNLCAYKRAKQQLIQENYEGIHCLDDQNLFIKKEFSLDSIGFIQREVVLNDLKGKICALSEIVPNYQKNRDFVDVQGTSDLSLELRFGIVGVRELLRAVGELENAEHFIRQLIFRDYYAYLLFHIPRLKTENFKYSFNGIANEEKFKRFTNGQTGVPIIDAGVRELLSTGKMHNRVRMLVASFFTKNLLLPWQWGERFFSRHLLDYDQASNVLSWQWSAGTGVDAQPYFRIFNPYVQSKKYDKEAKYIKKYCPELTDVDAKNLHDESYLHTHILAGYMKPIVDYKQSSKIAIEYFRN